MLRNLADNPILLLVLVGVVALLFGGRRLPEAARGLGRSMRIFKSEMKQMKTEDTPANKQTPVEGRVVDAPAPTAPDEQPHPRS
ncbi:MAG: Sec-independent protein translocase subunit TatA [Actinomycetota bacterium]